MELKHRATKVLVYIWNQDYSMLDKQMFGVSILDIAAIFFAVFILWEILKFFITITGNILQLGSRVFFSYLFNVCLVGGRFVWFRSSATAVYLWNIEPVQRFRDTQLERFSALTEQLKNSGVATPLRKLFNGKEQQSLWLIERTVRQEQKFFHLQNSLIETMAGYATPFDFDSAQKRMTALKKIQENALPDELLPKKKLLDECFEQYAQLTETIFTELLEKGAKKEKSVGSYNLRYERYLIDKNYTPARKSHIIKIQ